MATVRITDSLRYEVGHTIRSQFETRRAPLMERYTTLFKPSAELTDAVLGTLCEMTGVNRSDLGKVDGWLTSVPSIVVDSINEVDMPYRYRTIAFRHAIPVPTNYPQQRKLKSARMARWATELKDINEQVDALNEEEKAFTEQVDKLLRNCTTYRQALEIWPQLTSVTPQHIINRHNEPNTRTKPEAPNVTLDTDALNMTAVVNTIASATKDKAAT